MMEQMYNDFVSQVLPKIQDGLIITKDYFSELFGRYIHYLIVTDIIKTCIGLLFLLMGLYAIKMVFKNNSKWLKAYEDDCDGLSLAKIIICWILGIVFILSGFITTMVCGFNLIQDLYIPEIRILEILQYKIN